MMIHQIWIGEVLPPRWVESVRRACADYRLWTWEELMARYAGDEMTVLFERLMSIHPRAVTYALVSDYYRWRVVEDGGIYLDADIECRDVDVFSWLAMLEDGLWTIAERRMPDRACNAVILVQGESACKGVASVMQAMRERIGRLFPQGGTLEELVAVVSRDDHGGGIASKGVGPAFIRSLETQYSLRVLPHELVSASEVRAALFHHGVGSWMERRDEYVQDAVTVRVDVPAWRQAQSRAVAPARVRSHKRSALRVERSMVIPSSARRIVVFSNVEGFDVSRVGLRAGDHCVHINRARQWRKVAHMEGVTHSLFVRRGGERVNAGRPYWYAPDDVQGYEQVVFINDAQLRKGRDWWTNYCAVTRKSPTTGFICYQLACEHQLPVILAGFDPAVSHGTPLWRGHAWEYEREVYRSEGTVLVAP